MRVCITTVERLFNNESYYKQALFHGLRMEMITFLEVTEIEPQTPLKRREITAIYNKIHRVYGNESMIQGLFTGREICPIYSITYGRLYEILGIMTGTWVDVEHDFYTLNLNKFVKRVCDYTPSQIDRFIKEVIKNGKNNQ